MQLRRRLIFFVTVERDPLHRVLAGILDEMAGLDEHSLLRVRHLASRSWGRL